VASLDVNEARVLNENAQVRIQRIGTLQGECFLVKVAAAPHDRAEEALLAQEFEFFTSLRAQATLSPRRLAHIGDRLAACYEDVEVAPLAPERFDSPEFAEIVKAACATLAAVHAKGLVLGGLALESFMRDVEKQQIVLTDARFAQTAGTPPSHAEQLWINSPYLPYVAPELLGRSLPVDARSDLYALGAILYELISGERLFSAHDPAELIQCHLAKRPVSLQQRVRDLPDAIEREVMRLLAKDPGERRQDVREVRGALLAALPSTAGGPLSAGSLRVSAPAIVQSERLWGRDEALGRLRAGIAEPGPRPGLIFVEGAAGIGKSQLLSELQRLQLAKRFGSGKFQAGLGAPLGAWPSALRDLANFVLTRNSLELEAWRKRVREGLGDLAWLIVGLVPEWNVVLRLPPRVEPEGIDRKLNRLAMAIHRLVACFAEPRAPVVLVLEDLQWADDSSLKLLELLLTAPEPVGLVVCVTLRSGELGAPEAHEFEAFRDVVRASGSSVDTIALGPWGAAALAGFLDDSFGGKLEDVDGFVELLLAKTHGNALFVRELLKSLEQRGGFTFEPAQGRWRWDPRICGEAAAPPQHHP
jgi:hypothetical protein